MSSIEVEIDGNDLSDVAVSGSSTRRLNRVSQATVRVPMHLAAGNVGDTMKVSFNGNLHHHGRILNLEAEGNEDTGYVVYNSSDPMEMWQWRVVRADDGDFSLPSGSGAVDGTDIIATYLTGPEIMEAVLHNSEDTTAGGGGSPPGAAEGPLFLDFGTFETGGVALTGAPVDWPMTIAEFASLLCSTGELDLVITPTDPGGGIMGTIDAYNGDFGTDLSGSVQFEYATGALNVRQMRLNRDMTDMCNKLWYYLGPRVGTISDPAGDQHWRANITGDDPGLSTLDATATANVLALRSAAQSAYGVRMEVKIFDAQGDDDPVADFRDLYRQLWLIESWVRAQPRELVHFIPVRDVEIGSFDIGDLIGVEAGSAFMGGFSGAQRVFEYTIGWDEDSVLFLDEIVTSATADGIDA